MYKKKILSLLLIFSTLVSADTKEDEDNLYSRSEENTNMTQLQQMSDRFEKRDIIDKNQIIDFTQKHKIPLRQEFKDGRVVEIQKIEKGIPLYYSTHNEDAAISTRTDFLWDAPFEITGEGYTHLGEWDGGAVRGTHDELKNRVTQIDNPDYLSDHATHVAGTLIASGEDSSAKGMAYEANLFAYDWNSDESEMAMAATNGMELSNHSYGYITGWYGLSNWYGDTSISQKEAYSFGFYSLQSQEWDQIAYNAPNYLMVKAAGNDRNDDSPRAGFEHKHNGQLDANGNYYTDNHNSDGFDDGGYDTISHAGVAKNILTVGAVEDVTSFSSPSGIGMSSFSGWGPTDDGRIKPDIVGNGVGVKSALAVSDSEYASWSGTSMASPNITGTLALLQQYYKHTHGNRPMLSATLKALVLHTADEAGNSVGPDYQYGWGLLNAKRAILKIKENEKDNVIDELTLSNHSNYLRNIVVGEDVDSLKVTIVWTDPAGTPVAAKLDPTDKMLVHDLDLKITKGGRTYYPWKLDLNNPSSAATQNSKNSVDNVEQVHIKTPTSGSYKIVVNHSGTLSRSQNFSIIISSIKKGKIAKIILSEKFEGGEIPASWSVVDNISSPVIWGINSDSNIDLANFTNGSGDCAAASSDMHKNRSFDTELITPLLDLTGYSTISLSFSANYKNYANNDKFDVDISTDGGDTWTTKMQWDSDKLSTNVSLDLTTLVAQKNNVKIRFRYYDLRTNAWDYHIEIDDVLISGQEKSTISNLAPILMYLLD